MADSTDSTTKVSYFFLFQSWKIHEYAFMNMTCMIDGNLETFPRVFCFRKSRINENGGKQLWNESLKKFQAWTGFEPMTSTIPVQYSTKWALS